MRKAKLGGQGMRISTWTAKSQLSRRDHAVASQDLQQWMTKSQVKHLRPSKADVACQEPTEPVHPGRGRPRSASVESQDRSEAPKIKRNGRGSQEPSEAPIKQWEAKISYLKRYRAGARFDGKAQRSRAQRVWCESEPGKAEGTGRESNLKREYK